MIWCVCLQEGGRLNRDLSGIRGFERKQVGER
jgi:hypothetical protein